MGFRDFSLGLCNFFEEDFLSSYVTNRDLDNGHHFSMNTAQQPEPRTPEGNGITNKSESQIKGE